MVNGAELAKQSQWLQMNGAEPTCQQQRRLLLKQVGLEMMLEGAQSRIWYSEISWQTVPCSWSIDGEAAWTGSSPGMWDQQSPRRRGMQFLATMHGVGRHTQVSHTARGCIMQALPHKHRRLVDDSLAHWQPVQAKKNRRDVVVAMSPGDQAGCRVLHRLKSLKINISDPSHNRVAVVESTTNEGLD